MTLEDFTQVHDMNPLVGRALEWIERKYIASRSGKIKISGIPTGFSDLDLFTDGIQTTLSVIGSISMDHAKDFGISIGLNVAFSNERDYKVAYFAPGVPPRNDSNEKPKKELLSYSELLTRRALLNLARIGIRNINEGYIAERDISKITVAASKLKQGRFVFYDNPLDVEDFYRQVEHIKKNNGLDLVILDNLQALYRSRDQTGESFYWKAKDISAILHDIKSELGLPLIMLSEMKKGKKRSERLYPEDLRDFASFGNEIAPIMLLRKGTENDIEYEDESDGFRLDIHNNLFGPTDVSVNLVYFKEYNRFESAAKTTK